MYTYHGFIDVVYKLQSETGEREWMDESDERETERRKKMSTERNWIWAQVVLCTAVLPFEHLKRISLCVRAGERARDRVKECVNRSLAVLMYNTVLNVYMTGRTWQYRNTVSVRCLRVRNYRKINDMLSSVFFYFFFSFVRLIYHLKIFMTFDAR